jgi:hypothetical protein
MTKPPLVSQIIVKNTLLFIVPIETDYVSLCLSLWQYLGRIIVLKTTNMRQYLPENNIQPVTPSLDVNYLILPVSPDEKSLLFASLEVQGRLVTRGITSQVIDQHLMTGHSEMEPPYEVLSRLGRSASALVLLGNDSMDFRSEYVAEWRRSANRLHWLSLYFEYGLQRLTVDDLNPFDSIGLYYSFDTDNRSKVGMRLRSMGHWPVDDRLAAAIKP